jgi:hypothetical protein
MGMSLAKPNPILKWFFDMEMGLLYWGFCWFRNSVYAVDYFLDKLFGYTLTMGTRKERAMSEKYEYSAQLATIWGRGAYTIVENHQPNHFLLRHERYVHPNYILEHDNITLHGVTPTQAFFCVSDPSVNLYDTKVRQSQNGVKYEE